MHSSSQTSWSTDDGDKCARKRKFFPSLLFRASVKTSPALLRKGVPAEPHSPGLSTWGQTAQRCVWESSCHLNVWGKSAEQLDFSVFLPIVSLVVEKSVTKRTFSKALLPCMLSLGPGC